MKKVVTLISSLLIAVGLKAQTVSVKKETKPSDSIQVNLNKKSKTVNDDHIKLTNSSKTATKKTDYTVKLTNGKKSAVNKAIEKDTSAKDSVKTK